MKNKILAISIIFILISFTFINSCFAADTSELVELQNESLLNLVYDTDLYKSGDYYVFIGGNDFTYYKIWFIKKTDDLKAYITSRDSGFAIYLNNYTYTSVYTASESSTSLELSSSGDAKHNYFYSRYTLEFYSTIDIYSDNTYSDFFFKTPVPKSVLVQALETNNPIQVWTTQMKNVVVSLVVFLVGLIAFLKAWAWLKKQLHQA